MGVGVQFRGIMGEKVLLLIAALELWPALWNTKDWSDTLQWPGLVNICPSSGMPRFPLASPTNPNPDPYIHCTFNCLSSGFTHLGGGAKRHTHKMRARSTAKHVGSYLVTAVSEVPSLFVAPSATFAQGSAHTVMSQQRGRLFLIVPSFPIKVNEQRLRSAIRQAPHMV